MANFAPEVPQAPEPNYLRYSRPSNFAPINRGPGELIKTVGEGLTEGIRATDSVVKAGISSYINTEATKEQNNQIGLLESQYNSLTGANLNTQNRQSSSLMSFADENKPDAIKNAPDKMDAMAMWRAKGGYVSSAYDAQKNTFLKDLRSQYPGYTSFIDSQASRTFGDRNANEYIGALRSGIQVAESKIDSEQKRTENMVDSFYKEGNISNVHYSLYKQGKMSADQLINEGGINAAQNKQWEMISRRNSAKESEYKINAVEAEHAADSRRDVLLSRAAKDIAAVTGTDSTPKFIKYKAELDAGRREYLKPEEVQQFNNSLEQNKNMFLQSYSTDLVKSGLAEKMGSDVFTRKMKEAGEYYDSMNGLPDSKDYAAKHSLQKWMEVKTESEHLSREMSDTGRILRGFKDAQTMVGSNMGIEGPLSTMAGDWATKAEGNKALHALVFDAGVNAIAGPDKENPSTPEPNIHADINKLHSLGFKGDAHQIVLSFPDKITDPNLSDEQKRNLVDYTFGGDGAKLLPQIAKETIRTYPVSGQGRATVGRMSILDNLFDPAKRDAIYALGGKSWQTYTDYVDKSTKTLLGSELKDLDNISAQHYNLTWDSKNSTLGIVRSSAIMASGRVSASPPVTPMLNDEINNVNRILKGIKGVAEKQPGLDVNTYILKALTEGGLPENSPVAKQIMNAIIASHPTQGMPEGTPSPSNPLEKRSEIKSDETPMAMGPGTKLAMNENIIPHTLQPEIGPFGGESLGGLTPKQEPLFKGEQQGDVWWKYKGLVNPETGERGTLANPPNKVVPEENVPSAKKLIKPEQTADPFKTTKEQRKLDRTMSKSQEVAKRSNDIQNRLYERQEENIFANQAPVQSVLNRFRGNYREEELLNQKLDTLKIQASNYGEGPQVQAYKNDMKLIRKRLKEIKIEKDNAPIIKELEQGIKNTVKENTE